MMLGQHVAKPDTLENLLVSNLILLAFGLGQFRYNVAALIIIHDCMVMQSLNTSEMLDLVEAVVPFG